MLFTCYFAKIKDLPKDVLPISISGKAPEWYNGLEYKKLAPKYKFFKKWKCDHDDEKYIKSYHEQVLGMTNVLSVLRDLKELVIKARVNDDIDYKHIALICYEKPSDFCHRHIDAEWLTQNGVKCKEYEF